MSEFAETAADHGLANCRHCGAVEPYHTDKCTRCGATRHLRTPMSVQRSLAWLIVAIVLYIPANTLPIMNTVQLGRSATSTIIGGAVSLWEHGSYVIAIIILTASVLVPLAKICSLGWLCITVMQQRSCARKERAFLFQITEIIGRWSMIDVFVVAVLVALVQLENIMSITPGPAALSFCGVVIATMFSAMSFDSRLIWDTQARLEETQ